METLRVLACSLVIALASGCVAAERNRPPEHPRPAWIAANMSASVRIETIHGKVGTGFVVSRDGYIVANSHVLNETPICKVFWTDPFGDGEETEMLGVVEASYFAPDIAIVKVNNDFPFPVTLQDEVGVGETVYAVGTTDRFGTLVIPGAVMGLKKNLTLRTPRGEHSMASVAYAKLPLFPGLSGSAVFSAATGRCIGMVGTGAMVLMPAMVVGADGKPYPLRMPSPLSPMIVVRTAVIVDILRKHKVNFAKLPPKPPAPIAKKGAGIAWPPLPQRN